MKVKALQSFSGLKKSPSKGEIFEIDDTTGKEWVEIGYCEEIIGATLENKKKEEGKKTDTNYTNSHEEEGKKETISDLRLRQAEGTEKTEKTEKTEEEYEAGEDFIERETTHIKRKGKRK